MAEYQMQELTLPNEEDKKILFPRMKLSGQVDLNYIASHINYASSFTPGDIIGLTKALAPEEDLEIIESIKISSD